MGEILKVLSRASRVRAYPWMGFRQCHVMAMWLTHGATWLTHGATWLTRQSEVAGLSGGKQTHMEIRGLENVGKRGTRYGANRRMTRVQNASEPMITYEVSPRFLEEVPRDWLSHLPGSFIKRVDLLIFKAQ
nr:hypothetical protein [Tanacetum cinerariifolium]